MRRRLFAALCLALAAGFAALGVWQVERRAWKLDLIAGVEARVHAAPAPLPPRTAWSRDLAYTRVRVTGSYLSGRDTRVQALTDLGAGWWLMTPLRTAAGTLLVNRGFVPDDRPIATPAGRIVVTGLIRASEPGGGVLRRNDPAHARWYSRDVAAMAVAHRLGPVLPFFVDAGAASGPAGYPVGGLTVIAFRNNHLAYALTWFALSALSLGGAVLTLVRQEH